MCVHVCVYHIHTCIYEISLTPRFVCFLNKDGISFLNSAFVCFSLQVQRTQLIGLQNFDALLSAYTSVSYITSYFDFFHIISKKSSY